MALEKCMLDAEKRRFSDGFSVLKRETELVSCALCGRSIGEDDAYYDTYYQPLCLACLKELHKL